MFYSRSIKTATFPAKTSRSARMKIWYILQDEPPGRTRCRSDITDPYTDVLSLTSTVDLSSNRWFVSSSHAAEILCWTYSKKRSVLPHVISLLASSYGWTRFFYLIRTPCVGYNNSIVSDVLFGVDGLEDEEILLRSVGSVYVYQKTDSAAGDYELYRFVLETGGLA